MKTSTCLAWIVCWIASPLAAQEVSDWTEQSDSAVQALVAVEWDVAPDEVVLEWGPHRSVAPPDPASAELLGSGSGGYWIVRFDALSGAAQSVRVRAGHQSRKPVAAVPIARGTAIAPEHIAIEETITWGAPVMRGAEVQEGWVAQRALDKGDALREPTVRAPWIVRSGGPVELVWASGMIRVRVRGTAAGSGALGEEVRVRTESGQRMSGIIVAPGVVDLTIAASNAPGG